MDSDYRTGPDFAAERDAADPLSAFRERFSVPDELYLDGNSLGPVSDAAVAAVDRTMAAWRDLAIRGWTDAEPPWFWQGERLGDRLAPFVGAGPDEVVVANQTTVNIHSLIGTFLDYPEVGPAAAAGDPDGERPPGVLVNDLDFPTDHYAIRAQLRARGYDPDEHLHLVESRDGRTIAAEDVVAAMDAHDVGVVFMPSVLYRSGQLLDVERITEAAAQRGILAGFDLAHSVGVVPHDLSAHGVDFATWCSYKYLSAGPGAVAGLYVNEAHHGLVPALTGWWGNEKESQFEMNLTYTPADSAGAWQIGTIHVLSAAPLAGSLEILEDAGIDRVREKSLDLTGYLAHLVDERLGEHGYAVGSPRDPDRRGGHVAVEHDEAARISEALRDRGVIVDYRPPNVIRLCPHPLYTTYAQVRAAVEHLAAVVESGAHETVDLAGDVT
jgi:kynureninase